MQADAGAQAVQIFDSWASELAPQDFDIFSGPYIKRIIDSVRQVGPLFSSHATVRLASLSSPCRC